MKLLSAVRRKTGADRPLIHIIPHNEDRPHGHAGVHRIKKAPDHKTRGARIQSRILFFSHPDCNCRYRNSHGMPSVILLQTRSRSGRSRVTDSFTKLVVADFTAGGNFHPAPKNSCFYCEICSIQLHTTYYILLLPIVNILNLYRFEGSAGLFSFKFTHADLLPLVLRRGSHLTLRYTESRKT